MATLWISQITTTTYAVSPTLNISVTDNVGTEDSNSLSINGARLFIADISAQAVYLGGSPPDPQPAIWISEVKTDALAGTAPPSVTLFITITDGVGGTDETDNQRFDWQYEVSDNVGTVDPMQNIFTPRAYKVRKKWHGGEWTIPTRLMRVSGDWRPVVGV